MLQPLDFSNWSGPITLIAFMVSVGVFLFFLIGTLRTPRSRIEREAARPLEKETIL